MSRKLNDRMRAVTVVRQNFAPDWAQLDDTSPTTARKTSPVKVGDLIRFRAGAAMKEALVVSVGSWYAERLGDWIPFYNVRAVRKDGEFENVWRRVWPGLIPGAGEPDSCDNERAKA